MRLERCLAAMFVAAMVGCGQASTLPDGGVTPPDAGTDGGVGSDCGVESLRVTLDLEQEAILHLTPLYFTIEQAPGALEVLGADGKVLTSVQVPEPRPYTIIAPDGPHGDVGGLETIVRVIVPWPSGATRVRFGSEELVYQACSPRARKANTGATSLWQTGPIEERVNVLLMADGYTASEQGKFAADAERVADHFLDQEPFKTYRDLINVWSLPSVSRESGAGRDGEHKDTALRCAYGRGERERLLVCDNRRVHQAADNALADRDFLLVLVNDTKFGGTGGWHVATTFVGEGTLGVAVHELAHQTSLDDEYGYDETDYPDWEYEAGPNCSASRSNTPWEPWRDLSHIDAFAVCARPDRFRATDDGCRMRESETEGFCEVCRDHLVRWLYERAGKMARRKAPSSRDVRMSPAESLELSASVLNPGRTMIYRWSLDEESVFEGATSLQVDRCMSGRALFTVEDPTNWVRIGRPHVLTGGADWLLSCGPSEPGEVLLDERGHVDLGEYKHHSMHLSSPTKVLIKVSGRHDVDFYVGMDQWPSKDDHDASAFGRGDDFLHYLVPKRGHLLISVHGYEASNYHLTVERDELD